MTRIEGMQESGDVVQPGRQSRMSIKAHEMIFVRVRKAKKKSWEKLCNDLNGNIWWKVYKIVTKDLK